MASRREVSDEVTELLRAWRGGDEPADARLVEHVYSTLRHLAVSQLRGERHDHTLQPTALVHEAYLRLIGQREVGWRDRAHFFGLAAVTMRRILVDHARRRQAKKRSPEVVPEGLNVATEDGEADLLRLDHALVAFAERFPRQAKVVELRYFSGLDFESVARSLDLSLRTAKRDWSFARAWLRDAMATARSSTE
jgi:RNA polymerase sigma factor (TIGR02999 family)